jgi:hypothetical protein
MMRSIKIRERRLEIISGTGWDGFGTGLGRVESEKSPMFTGLGTGGTGKKGVNINITSNTNLRARNSNVKAPKKLKIRNLKSQIKGGDSSVGA